jgi:hypothetical protein
METVQEERTQEITDLGMASGPLAVMKVVEITGIDPDSPPIVTMNGCGRTEPGPCPAACQQQGWCVLGG